MAGPVSLATVFPGLVWAMAALASVQRQQSERDWGQFNAYRARVHEVIARGEDPRADAGLSLWRNEVYHRIDGWRLT